RKSWFCLDSAVVALGSGVTSTDGRRIETVVENRATRAEPYLGDGWAHLPGAGGYVFDGVSTLVETRTGRWRDINAGDDTEGAADLVSRRYVTFWYDHGVDPCDAAYAYVLLPNATRERTRSFHRARPARVLANTRDVQAVRTRSLLGATFWTPGTAGIVSVDRPCVVMLRRAGERLSLAVADPSRTVDVVTITLGRSAREVVRADETVSVRTGRTPVITVAVGGSLGRSHGVELSGSAPGSP
ncbi:polysaccharide lyase family 8 super-sandwich domain-containing protein, partial [Nonomuraea fuscirosea]